jgi:hypothetical protein
MMTRRCRHGVALLALLTAVACSHGGRERTAPADPFANLGVGQIPVTGLAGTDALLFPVDAVLFGDSLSGLVVQRGDLRDRASALLDSVLTRDARGVTWHDQEAMRRLLRRAPGLAADPTDLPTGFLLAKRVEGLPDPLWASIRVLAALSGARVALIPVAVRLEGRTGAVSATYALAIVDVRTGQLVWRARVTGPEAPAPEDAFRAAAAVAVPTGIR